MDRNLSINGAGSTGSGAESFPLWYRNTLWGDGKWRIWNHYRSAFECEIARWSMPTKIGFAGHYEFSTRNPCEDE